MAINPNSQYYLHQNGKVIYKPHGGVDFSSPFVMHIWHAIDFAKGGPQSYVKWLGELKRLGALQSEIDRLYKEAGVEDFIPEEYKDLTREILGIHTTKRDLMMALGDMDKL